MERKAAMNGKPLVLLSFLACLATVSALNCHACEVANPYNGCIWGKSVCATGTNGTCETRIAKFGPLFFLAWLGCAHQSHSYNRSGLQDSFFGFSYSTIFCDSADLCNRLPQPEYRWPWSAAACPVLPSAAGILTGVLLTWMHLI